MFDSVTEALSASPWTYAIVAGLVAADAVVPLLPGETVVITAAVLATGGELFVGFVVVAAFAGAMLGDNANFGLGRLLGRRAVRRVARSDTARARVDWADRQLRERGSLIIVMARFIPGGRTATTLAAGSLDMGWPRFLRADALGAALWATVVTALGWFGGTTFTDSFAKATLVSLTVVGLIALAGEMMRRRSESATHDR